MPQVWFESMNNVFHKMHRHLSSCMNSLDLMTVTRMTIRLTLKSPFFVADMSKTGMTQKRGLRK